ncbi:RNA-guided endonuclease InsQ/TnpB family protein [Clostridium sporogenes]|uniref:RNA-guided endonuclease InsQ/TnpB family protein n=1 Tax=Clostridium sporogenes TaxID=1509 RepID=UPI0013CF73D4|nr:RNA-guided endonuclease TnpB family protein [Clostridium sporogenes]NFH40835.1 IS200/IS605 family element transposase accessory protein TnpB [Clostridium sporogenes]
MKLSFKYYSKLNQQQLDIIEELSYHTTKLYNIANYDCRENTVKSYVEMNKLYNNNYHKQFLHSHNYQQCLKLLEKNWKSYFASIKDYKKNPSKYKGIPRQPKFKNTSNKKNEIIFTQHAIRIQDSILKLSLSKEMKSKFQVQSLNFNMKNIKIPVDLTTVKQIKLQWDNSKKIWYLNIIWVKEETDTTKDYDNIMSIDLGLNNLATITFENNIDSYIIDGKYIRSKNSYYNKEIARITSIAMKQSKSSKYFKRTKQLNKLQTKRNNFIKDYIHKASKKIIDLAIFNKCHTIVIGDFKGVKQLNVAKSFVQTPQQQLVDKIKYKAELLGIKIIMQEESYTSGCSALDLEEICKDSYNKNRRIYRGLFKSNKGLLINADINGSLNIMRKYLKCTPRSLVKMMDNGFLNNPIRLRVA